MPKREPKRRSIREDALNLPNLLTSVRIVLIPVVLYLLAAATPAANFWATGPTYSLTLNTVVPAWPMP